MNAAYNPDVPSPILIHEIQYFIAFSALKKLVSKGIITLENAQKAHVAIAQTYGVLPYYL